MVRMQVFHVWTNQLRFTAGDLKLSYCLGSMKGVKLISVRVMYTLEEEVI